MARYVDLYTAAETLAQAIAAHPDIAADDVLIRLPDQNLTGAGQVFISLLWITPQPSHRNDEIYRADGRAIPPPPTYSITFLITTFGVDDHAAPIDAYNLLGRVLAQLHRTPVVSAGTGGEGELGIVHVPVDLDVNEKVFAPLELRHQPWALIEVGPVQLIERDESTAAKPMVVPGGMRLGPTRAVGVTIDRVVPDAIPIGGRVWIEGSYSGPVEAVSIGGIRHEAPNLIELIAGERIAVTLLAGVGEGVHAVSLLAGGVWSQAASLRVLASDAPGLFAPDSATHDPSLDLTLAGVNLHIGAGPNVAYVWPDGSIAAPSEFVTVALTLVVGVPAAGDMTDSEVVLPASAFAREGRFRVALALAPAQFVSWIVVEVRS